MTALSEDGRAEQSAAHTVADDLAQHILTQLTPGSSLPSEAELAEHYAVSRLTVREAVKLLAGRGLLQLARGRKAVGREPDGAAFADFLTSVIRYDSKGLLEVQSATLAAKHASRAGIAAIESALQGMREAALSDAPDAETVFHTCDVGFHEAVALASGNRVLGYLFEAMATPLREGLFISRRGHASRGHTLQDTIDAHQRILDCIREGNGRAAAEAMRVHLKDTQRDIRIAVTKLAILPTSTGNRSPSVPALEE